MKRTVILLAVLLGFAMSANAATLTMTANDGGDDEYALNETIVITLTGTAFPSDLANGAFVQIRYEAGLTDPVSGSQTPHVQGMMNLPVTNSPPAVIDGFANLINQAFSTGSSPASVNTFDTVATATLVATNASVLNVTYYVNAADPGATMNYFGITSQAGLTFLIVPEPTTAALVGLGLVGLVLGGRRRS